MDNGAVQLNEPPCGQHGPYTFYRSFKYLKNGIQRTVRLSEFFFVKLWSDSDLVCIGELQLLWIDKNSEQVLSSLRLYFLPENTPDGRMDHGEDEVLAIAEKVVIRLEDLVTWITVDAEWSWGRLAKCEADAKEPKCIEDEKKKSISIDTENSFDVLEIEKEKITNDSKHNTKPSVVILSYSEYCRYRSIMKRLEGVEEKYLKNTVIKLLGGFTAPNSNTRVLFCRDTFEYPELEGHELLCNHLAPKLKGRPRGRRKKRSLSPGSESNESECSVSNTVSTTKTKIMTEGNPNGFRSECGISTRRSTRAIIGNTESKEFINKLSLFMKANHTPMGRIPSLGYKELDLYSFFTKVDKLGGYNAVTSNRLWKSIFDDLSGNYISTSAATVIRRHYERFLLPYERYLKGEEYKPPSSIKRIKSSSGSGSDADTSEGTSCSGSTTPIPQLVPVSIPLVSMEKEHKNSRLSESSSSDKGKLEAKTSSLRSVRLKSERLRDNPSKEPAHPPIIKENNVKYTENNNEIVKDEIIDITTELPESAFTVEVVNNKNVPEIKEEIVKVEGQPAITVSVQKLGKSKTLNSDEVKENIATCNTDTSEKTSTSDVDLTEVPYRPKTETIKSETDSSVNDSTFNSSLLHSFKKRKLDILKEGGLEVTPVKPSLEVKEVKDNRPSVIHQPSAATTTVGQLSITLTPDKQETNGEVQQLPANMTGMIRSSFKTPMKKTVTPMKNSFPYMNGQSPPVPIQSRSIYSYSERTVYGNPKDYFMPPPRPQVPKFVDTPRKQTGGDILDLTIKSPQKPIVEIMRVPQSATRTLTNPKDLSHRKDYKNVAASLPVLDARVGSNLEITLVGSNNMPQPATNKMPGRPPQYVLGQTAMANLNQKYGNYAINNKSLSKRPTPPSGAPESKKENGRISYQQHHMTPLPPTFSADSRHRSNNSFNRHLYQKMENQSKSSTSTANINRNSSKTPNNTSNHMPDYLNQLSLASKMMPPYAPPVDPLYFQAIQNIYPHGSLPNMQPYFPVPTPEQLQFYTELLAHNSQMRYQFPYPQDYNPSLSNGTAEINRYKKQ